MNILEEYKWQVWAKLPESPATKANRVIGSVAIQLGINKFESKLVGRGSYRYGNNIYYPKKNIDLLKTFAVQTPIGTLTMKGFSFLNKKLSGENMPFLDFVFDEIIGKVPGGAIMQNLIKYTKLGKALLNSTSAPVQVRNGDMLYKYEMVGRKRGKIQEFEYVEYLMLVDPYRIRNSKSSWVLHERRSPLKIVEVPYSFKSRLSLNNQEKTNKEGEPSWLRK